MSEPREPAFPHLLRRAENRWWHPLAGLAVLGLVWAVAAGALSGISSTLGAEPARGRSGLDVALLGLTLVALIPGAVAAVVWVHRTRASVLLAATRRLRLDLFVVAAVIAAAAFVPMALAKTASFSPGPESAGSNWDVVLPLALAVVLVFPFQAAAEEIAFRGYVTQAAAIWTRRVLPAMVVSSLLFVAIHNTQDAWTFADRFFFGLAMCWLTWRTGGLEAAIALHVVYNLLLGLSVAATGRMEAMVHASTSDALGTLTSMGGTALAAGAVAWWAQDRRVVADTGTSREAAYR